MSKAVKAAKPRKNAGQPKETGNITVDLGEEIDKKLRSVVRTEMGGAKGSSRSEIGRSKDGNYRPGTFGGYRPGGYRPGMFGGYRPWYADKSSVGSSLGMAWLNEPVKPAAMLGGMALGILANRALMRVSPDIVKSNQEFIHTGIAFLAGMIPVMVKPNSITIGVAVPGAVFFAGSLVDMAMNAVGIKKPSLSGGASAPASGHAAESAISAKEKLQNLAQQIRTPAAAQFGQQQRAVARAV